MALSFPNTPAVGQTVTANGITYVWNGVAWDVQSNNNSDLVLTSLLVNGPGRFTGDVVLPSLNGGPLAGLRNRVINGDMRIDQRNNGAAVSMNNGGGYVVDRFNGTAVGGVGTGVIAFQQVNAPAGSAFIKAFKATVTTAKASPAAGDLFYISHKFEGLNISDLLWGTSAAKSVVLSFEATASIAGTYGVGVFNAAGTRSYVATYTITAANTPQQVSLVIPGETTGAWVTDSNISIAIDWDLGSGSTFNAPAAGSWNTATYIRTAGCVSSIQTLNATLHITGVQFEPGSVATPFERRPVGLELILSQRYYEKQLIQNSYAYCYSGSTGVAAGTWQVRKRANPTTAGSNLVATGLTGVSVSSTQGSVDTWTLILTTSNTQGTVGVLGCTVTGDCEL